MHRVACGLKGLNTLKGASHVTTFDLVIVPGKTRVGSRSQYLPAELVPHLVEVVSGPAELRLHVVTAAVKLRLHGLHLVGGEREAALQVLILLLEDSG